MQTPGEQAFAQHSAQQMPSEERKETIKLLLFATCCDKSFPQSYRCPRLTDEETEAERFSANASVHTCAHL